MALISRQRPPRVRQSLEDSCWASVLESWSRADARIAEQEESSLIERYGEGPTGGITPASKIPLMARSLGLRWGGYASSALHDHLLRFLPSSHIFCAYRNGQYQHAVLVYGYNGRILRIMDPYRGQHRTRPLTWFRERGPYAIMWR